MGGRRRFGALTLAGAAGLVFGAPVAGQGDSKNVVTGAEALARDAFASLGGRRVGLIVNHTSRTDTLHLIDAMGSASGLKLVALFAPEHGLRGKAYAGEDVVSGRDAETGLPVHSLFGQVHAPTDAMLEGIDTLVFDIQDVGARFYTYITTMGLAMRAAARARVRFVVLDRPNPLGGDYVSGFVMREAHRSFIGKYPVPIAHGMTVGELAAMIRGEGFLEGLEDLDLEVVSMDGWRRSMLWPDTGVAWIDPSPAIVDFDTALVYAGTGLFEATATNYGRGTDAPFRLIGAPWVDGKAIAQDLNAQAMPGVRFEAVRFTPRVLGSGFLEPKFVGQELPGVRLDVTDARACRPVETGVAMLEAFVRAAAGSGQGSVIDKPDWLAKMAGTSELLELLVAGRSADEIAEAWASEVEAFRVRRAPYLLYT